MTFAELKQELADRGFAHISDAHRGQPVLLSSLADDLTVARGLCRCGCGEPAAVAKFTNRQRGLVKGQRGRFAHPGHARRKSGARYVVDGNGCWVWQGSTSRGYGMTWRDGKHVYAHRLAYIDARGAIPDGLEIDHLCCNKGCVNPDHLEAVTRSENMLRHFARKAA